MSQSLRDEAPGEITRALLDFTAGDRAAGDDLIALCYEELRRIARRKLRRRPNRDSLDPAELVSEATLRILKAEKLRTIENREQFFNLVGRAMLDLMIDQERAKASKKRGAGAPHLSISTSLQLSKPMLETIEIRLQLERLRAKRPDLASALVLTGLFGYTDSEAAERLGVSVPTLRRRRRAAEAMLGDAFRRG